MAQFRVPARGGGSGAGFSVCTDLNRDGLADIIDNHRVLTNSSE